MKKRILFITQDLARSGSEMMLWYLLKNLNADQYTVFVFCIKPGEMYEQLPDYIQKDTSYKYGKNLLRLVWRALLKAIGIDPLTYQLKKIQADFKADIWYINTLAMPGVFRMAKKGGLKIVTHIHELLHAFSLIKGNELEKMIALSDVCIACSDEVAAKLTALGHPDIRTQYSFIDTNTIIVDPGSAMEIRQQLGIATNDFVWVISGRATYMKGQDYVLSILEHFKNFALKIIWIGPEYNSGLDYYIRQVADKNYPGKFITTGSQSADYYNYMAVANGVLLLSREESFSLAIVEAAFLGKPVVAFNVGIAQQFIKEGMGSTVEAGDLKALYEAMNRLHQHPSVNEAEMKAAAALYSSAIQVPKFNQLLKEVCIDLAP